MKKIIGLFICFLIGQVNASVILNPDQVWTDGSYYSAPIGNTINQSGLSATYTSGVDDFDSFVATTTANWSAGVSNTLGDNSSALDNFYFDLGGIFTIDRIAIWNQAGSATLKSFNLYSASDSGFSATTLLGSYGGILNDGYDDFADVFSFASVSTQYVMIDVTENYGFSSATRLNEVAFRGTANSVPEPSAIALMGLGLLGFVATRRRLQK